jgi:hypothetical protein
MTAAHEPTPEMREIVRALSSFGVAQAKISGYLDLDEKTLRLHYRREIDHGRDLATAEVVHSLHRLATKENGGMPSAIACKIWLQLIAGRTEKTAIALDLNPETPAWPEGQSPRERLMAKLDALNANLTGKQETVEHPAANP